MKPSTIVLAVALLTMIAAPAHASGITYTYDALGRVITLTYDNGTQITYAYDAAGNRTTQGVTCGTGGC
jgi:YD repeat-containing protein